MKHSKYNRIRSLALAPYILAILAGSFIVSSAQGQDWDGDGILDASDWGVVLTFDMHPNFPAETPAKWNYPGDWSTFQPSILEALSFWKAPATFFVSGFDDAAPDPDPNAEWTWNDLLNDAVAGQEEHELAWHGREHIDHPNWNAVNGNDWTSAWNYVDTEVRCDVPNYTGAKSSHPGWPSSLTSYAYPGCVNGNPGDLKVDWFLSQHVGHARASGGVPGPYDTETIASQFRLGAYWLDNKNLCDTSNCTLDKARENINQAYRNKEIAVFAAHHFKDPTTASTGMEFETQLWVLWTLLDHIDCLHQGGTLPASPPAALCEPAAVEDTSANPKVFHRFRDLPAANSLTDVPAASGDCNPRQIYCS